MVSHGVDRVHLNILETCVFSAESNGDCHKARGLGAALVLS